MDIIAKMYDVNSGRVSEAITVIEYAADPANIKQVYQMARKVKSRVETSAPSR